jgi:hypothetical protein
MALLGCLDIVTARLPPERPLNLDTDQGKRCDGMLGIPAARFPIMLSRGRHAFRSPFWRAAIGAPPESINAPSENAETSQPAVLTHAPGWK